MEVTRGMSLCGKHYATEGNLMRLTLGNFDYHNNCFKDDKSKDNLYFTGSVKKDFILNKDDIITPLTEQAIGLLGSTAKIPFSGKYIQSQDVALIKCNEKLYPDFAFYLIPSKMVRFQLSAAAQQTKIRHTSPDKIKDCTVWVPEYSVQKKIGDLLTTIDKKISINREINRNLEEQMKLLYEYLMSKINSQHIKGKYLLAKDLTTVITGKKDASFSTPNGQYKFFTCSNEPLQCDKYKFDQSSILIAGNGDFNVKHYTGKFNAYQRTYILSPAKKYYSILYLASLYRINSFKSKSTGSIVKFITKEEIENIPIFIPENTDLLFILNKILNLKEKYSIENESLIKIRDFLLPMLMNGQATISD